MSLSSLRNEISRLESQTRNLHGESLGNYNWRQCFVRMLDELDRTLKDMDYSIDDLDSRIRNLE